MTPKRPRDPNQLAKSIIDIATGQVTESDPEAGKDASAVALGRKGGEARARQLKPPERQEIAKAAAAARWKKSDDEYQHVLR
jgi:hypothetical protein